jgi:sodium pump decarboxylase gamma subunit
MLEQGLPITVLGMSVVFTFLTLLVISMYLLNAILRTFFPKTMVEEVVSTDGIQAEIAVAIAAAKAYTKK